MRPLLLLLFLFCSLFVSSQTYKSYDNKFDLAIPNNKFPTSNLYSYLGTTLQVKSSNQYFHPDSIEAISKKIGYKLKQINQFNGWKLILNDLFDKRIDEESHNLKIIRTKLKITDSFLVDIYELNKKPTTSRGKEINTVVTIPDNTKNIKLQLHARERKLSKEEIGSLVSKNGWDLEYEFFEDLSGNPHKYILATKIDFVESLISKMEILEYNKTKFMVVFYDDSGNRIIKK